MASTVEAGRRERDRETESEVTLGDTSSKKKNGRLLICLRGHRGRISRFKFCCSADRIEVVAGGIYTGTLLASDSSECVCIAVEVQSVPCQAIGHVMTE
jgi:hypothetical protein